jgi:hypothetical protein
MADDGETRKVRAVRRKKASSVADAPTRAVKAVRRRTVPNAAAAPLGLLPTAALKARTFRFVESNGNWKSGFAASRFCPAGGSSCAISGGALRFTLRLSFKKLAALFMDRVYFSGEDE